MSEENRRKVWIAVLFVVTWVILAISANLFMSPEYHQPSGRVVESDTVIFDLRGRYNHVYYDGKWMVWIDRNDTCVVAILKRFDCGKDGK